jgi:hypothetical protein
MNRISTTALLQLHFLSRPDRVSHAIYAQLRAALESIASIVITPEAATEPAPALAEETRMSPVTQLLNGPRGPRFDATFAALGW